MIAQFIEWLKHVDLMSVLYVLWMLSAIGAVICFLISWYYANKGMTLFYSAFRGPHDDQSA